MQPRSLLFFILAGTLLAAPAAAQVYVYDDCNYGGKSVAFGEGSYPLASLTSAGLADNSVSSVVVPNGYQVTFYDGDAYQGASLVRTSDAICLVDAGWNDRATSFKVAKIAVAAPPTTWQEHWFEHNQLLTNVYYDNDLALYYDGDVSRTVTWPNTYLGDVWRYTKSVYGSFGGDGRLFAVLHTVKYSGGHPSTYFDASHDYRNTIDVGGGSWTNGTGNDLDLTTHEVAHIVELASKGVYESPAFGIWGDSKWAEIFIYDVYKGLNRPSDAARWYNLMVVNSNNFPRAHTYWFRDWFYPIYSKYGGAATLNRYFELLAKYYPKTNNSYSPMNWGELVHFWSGAAGTNLKPLATLAFGWSATWENQFNQARTKYPFTYPNADNRVVALNQDSYYGGYAVGLAPGSYTTAALVAAGVADNDVTSLRVPAGYTVTLYDNDNFTGASLLKTADDSTLVDDGWNDRASSVVVQAAGAANLALKKPARASSVQSPSWPAAGAVDGSLSTRWSSAGPSATVTAAQANAQWLRVDLGASYAISRVKLTWENAYGKDYVVEIAPDTVNWTPLKTVTGNTVLVNDWPGLAGTGRFVRMRGVTRGTGYGYSIKELEVYGAPAASARALATAPAGLAEPLGLYPNPVTHTATLTGLAAYPATVGVYDVKGAQVRVVRLETAADAKVVDFSSLGKGLYLLRISSQGAVQTQRLLKE